MISMNGFELGKEIYVSISMSGENPRQFVVDYTTALRKNCGTIEPGRDILLGFREAARERGDKLTECYMWDLGL